MITVITPTVRPEGLKLVEKALKRQTFTDYEWLVVEPIPIKRMDLVWQLNHDYNRGIRRSKGELIVSWQDWTYADPTTLERFWQHYLDEPKTLVTAVGNKYSDDTWTVETWRDPRMRSDQGSYYSCFFNDIEFNLCSVPKQAFYDVGGFDEELDKWYGMDGYSVVDRLNMIGGYDFKIDQTIKSYSLEHGRPEKWEELNALHGPYNERRKAYVENPKLGFLK